MCFLAERATVVLNVGFGRQLLCIATESFSGTQYWTVPAYFHPCLYLTYVFTLLPLATIALSSSSFKHTCTVLFYIFLCLSNSSLDCPFTPRWLTLWTCLIIIYFSSSEYHYSHSVLHPNSFYCNSDLKLADFVFAFSLPSVLHRFYINSLGFMCPGNVDWAFLLFPATPHFIFHTAALIHAWELPSATTDLYCQPADSITGTFPVLNALLKYTLTSFEEVEVEEYVSPFTFHIGFSSL